MQYLSEGTVSHGTMRLEDLLPEFLATLKSLEPDEDEQALIECIEETLRDEVDYYYSQLACDDLEQLFDALDHHVPEGYYFGAHPGDGSDFGCWQDEEA